MVSRLWNSPDPVTFDGEHPGQDAQLGNRPDPVPPIFSSAAHRPRRAPVAARFSDTYLTWGEPPADRQEGQSGLQDLPPSTAKLTYSLPDPRHHPGHRGRGWAVADRLLAGIDPRTSERMQANLRRSESEAATNGRITQGWNGFAGDRPEPGPGVGLVRGGAGTALVGSHEEVAARIVEYSELGIGHFILSGYPHLEEAFGSVRLLPSRQHRRPVEGSEVPGRNQLGAGQPLGLFDATGCVGTQCHSRAVLDSCS